MFYSTLTTRRKTMKKIFWENPYQCTLETTVEAVNGNKCEFEETIAYSEAGGQESDKATVNGLPILDSTMPTRDQIIYTLPDNHGLKVGDKVKMEIDWPRRNRLMRLHFSCELVLVIVNRLFGKKPVGEELAPKEIDVIGPFKTGAHMTEDGARVSFLLAENMIKYLDAILKEFNRIIDEDLPIEKGYLNEETQERFWRIKGFALVPCGGTHVDTTSEIGRVNLKRENGGKYKGQPSEKIRISLVDPSPRENKFAAGFFNTSDKNGGNSSCSTLDKKDASTASPAVENNESDVSTSCGSEVKNSTPALAQ